MKAYKIAEDLYYVGVNDREKTKFDHMIPLPYGISYNAYLINDEKIALVDSVEAPFVDETLAKIESVIGDKPVDYLIIHHMEPDHSSGIRQIVSRYPNIKIVGNAKIKDMLEGFYGVVDHFVCVKENDELCFGSHTLLFKNTPMVHWPEVMMSYEKKSKTLFSADGFGSFGSLDGAVLDTQLNYQDYFPEMKRYYANIVAKYGFQVQAALKKFTGLKLNMICSLHGPVWTKHLYDVVNIYDSMSKFESEPGIVICYGSMHGNTGKMAEAVARGVHEITPNVHIYDVGEVDHSFILSAIMQNKGVILGAPTYCNTLYPPMMSLMNKIEIRGIKYRKFAAFSSFSWANKAKNCFTAFNQTMKWDEGPVMEVKQAMNLEDEEALIAFGRTFAQQVIEK